MRHIEIVTLVGQATFGRDAAMFESLTGFVAQLSVMLWILVILTAMIRFVGLRIYGRSTPHTADGRTVAARAAIPATGQLTDTNTNATFFDEAPQSAGVPAAVAAPAKVPDKAPRHRHVDSGTGVHVSAVDYARA